VPSIHSKVAKHSFFQVISPLLTLCPASFATMCSFHVIRKCDLIQLNFETSDDSKGDIAVRIGFGFQSHQAFKNESNNYSSVNYGSCYNYDSMESEIFFYDTKLDHVQRLFTIGFFILLASIIIIALNLSAVLSTLISVTWFHAISIIAAVLILLSATLQTLAYQSIDNDIGICNKERFVSYRYILSDKYPLYDIFDTTSITTFSGCSVGETSRHDIVNSIKYQYAAGIWFLFTASFVTIWKCSCLLRKRTWDEESTTSFDSDETDVDTTCLDDLSQA